MARTPGGLSAKAEQKLVAAVGNGADKLKAAEAVIAEQKEMLEYHKLSHQQMHETTLEWKRRHDEIEKRLNDANEHIRGLRRDMAEAQQQIAERDGYIARVNEKDGWARPRVVEVSPAPTNGTQPATGDQPGQFRGGDVLRSVASTYRPKRHWTW